MTQDVIVSLWRFNINMSIYRKYVPLYTASALPNTQAQYYLKLFNKETREAVHAYMNISTVIYLKEIAASLAVKHLANTNRLGIDLPDKNPYLSPIRFHMMEGQNVAEMLFCEANERELLNLKSIISRNLPSHPEAKPVEIGIDKVIQLFTKKDTSKIYTFINENLDRTKNYKIVSGHWEQIGVNAKESVIGKVDIFFTENAVRPFNIRISNIVGEQEKNDYTYPSSNVKSYIISLSSEEFIANFLMAMYQDNQKNVKDENSTV